MRLPFPRRRKHVNEMNVAALTLQSALDDLGRTLAVTGIKHVVRHEPRPPAPRPERITVVYEMQDGREFRTFIPLHGQAEWTESWPHWLDIREPGYPPVAIRYHLGYSDSY